MEFEPEYPLLLTEDDGSAPQCIAFQGGELFLHSQGAPGKDRVNQDAAALVRWGATGGLLAVADGLGGKPQAEQASAILVRALGTLDTSPPDARGELGTLLVPALALANAAIMDLGVGAGTTLAAAEFGADAVRTHHVGDSMAALVDAEGLVKWRTVEHSPVGFALEAGLLTELEAMSHPDRHVISNMVGSTAMEVDRSDWFPWEPGDRLVLASDGLTDNMLTQEWVEMLCSGPPSLAGPALVDLASRRMQCGTEAVPGKSDDLTVLVYHRA